MKSSPYITWAKSKHHIAYNLGRSGVPGVPLNEIVDRPAGILETGEHEDGWLPLMEQIAGRYAVEAEQVILVHGASMANHMVCSLLLEPGDEVLVEMPVYEPLRLLPEYFHTQVIPISRPPSRNFQPDPDEIMEKVSPQTKLLILSDLHNPSGMLLDRTLLKKIIRIAENRSFQILIDEVYLEFLYPKGERTSALLSPHVITTRSLTKAYGLDDLRIGWIIAEKEQATLLRRLRDLFSITTALPSERIAGFAISKADIMLQKTLKLLQRNMIQLDTYIQTSKHLSWECPPAGSVGFVKMISGDVDRFNLFLERNYETLITPGRFFGMPDYFRIGWGMAREPFDEAFHRFTDALDTFFKGNS